MNPPKRVTTSLLVRGKRLIIHEAMSKSLSNRLASLGLLVPIERLFRFVLSCGRGCRQDQRFFSSLRSSQGLGCAVLSGCGRRSQAQARPLLAERPKRLSGDLLREVC